MKGTLAAAMTSHMMDVLDPNWTTLLGIFQSFSAAKQQQQQTFRKITSSITADWPACISVPRILSKLFGQDSNISAGWSSFEGILGKEIHTYLLYGQHVVMLDVWKIQWPLLLLLLLGYGLSCGIDLRLYSF